MSLFFSKDFAAEGVAKPARRRASGETESGASTMSGPERIFIFEDGFVGTWPSSASPWLEWTHIDRKTHEAVVRELAAAREKLESVTVVKDGMIRVAKELSDEVERLRALLDELRIAVMEMHHDNVKGDFELPPLARIDLDACVAKCSDERIPRAGG